MSWLKFWQRQRALAQCAPFSETRMHEKSMRIAAYRARKAKTAQTFHQQAFDRAVAGLVGAIRAPEDPNGS